MGFTEMWNQRANFNRIDEAINNGNSYETLASALRDKGMNITATRLQNYHEVNKEFESKRFLSSKEIKTLNDPFGSDDMIPT